MSVLKYPLYIVMALFVVLTVYSVSTEKPRQFKAKTIDEAASKPLPELWRADEAFSNALKPKDHLTGLDTSNLSNSSPLSQDTSKSLVAGDGKSAQSVTPHVNTNVVVAYSNNDVGGKIVLTVNKCEKLAGTVAYTTAPDGKVDYGCWSFDELYIVINWDKEGINNYTYDKFFDISSNERLTPKHLFEVAKDSISKPKLVPVPVLVQVPASTTPAGAQVTSNSTGAKK